MFNFLKEKAKTSSAQTETAALLTAIYNVKKYVYSAIDLKGITEYEELKDLSDDEQKELIVELTELIAKFSIKQAKEREKNRHSYRGEDIVYYGKQIAFAIQGGLMRRKLNYNEAEWIDLFKRFKACNDLLEEYNNYYFSFNSFPVNFAIKQIEYFLKKNEGSETLTAFVKEMLTWEQFSGSVSSRYYGSDLGKATSKLRALIAEEGVAAKFSLETDDIGTEIDQMISQIKNNEDSYHKIFELAANASSSKPSKKFSKAVLDFQDEIGQDKYRKLAQQILAIPANLKFREETHTSTYNGRTHEYTTTNYLCNKSQQFVKGMVWTMQRYSDKESIRILSKLCERSYSKIPGIGPAAASIGNACVLILGNMRGKDGLGALSRLKLKIRQNSVKKRIDKLLTDGAKKYNVSVEELKEMAVPDFHLEKGSKTIAFDDYQLTISIEGSRVTQQFFKPDGTTMKSVPSAIKNSTSLSNKLKAIRKEVKEIQKVFSAQKQRIDNQFILNRSWDLPSFNKFYLDHGLVYPITAKLIWTFTKGKQSVNAILLDHKWYTVEHEHVDWIDKDTTVRLWHPVNADEKTIIAWREKMMELQLKQPVKQAFREIYILTDAELNTRTYSNRMAAHILKQHQFNTLAALRDWKYSLMGAYDDGRDNETCKKHLPEYGITAEYWIDELSQDDQWNDAGIWYYIATDQVKFKNEDGLMDLIDVPKIVFTEIMRDVDMFVGVCSVGNDPQWMDNNGERQSNRDYWTSYSFGDLTEIAKTRKVILERLLPRLKIRDKAKIEGKFLIVTGKIRTYKIHIGSGNILMEPNDQYLCIVPARSTKSTDKLFIPFEGDKGLSIVLSKAFLLAEDDKITDSTIVSQIQR